MGGRSSSSSSQQSQQDTRQLTSDGVVGRDLVQAAGNVTINDAFPDRVAEAFDELIKLTGQGLSLAGEAGEFAIQQVSERREVQENPELQTLTRILPVFMIGIVVIGAVLIFRKK